MKMMNLAVLLATVLLLTGVAFAADCQQYCYEFIGTNLDDPEDTHPSCERVTFCDDNTGSMTSPYCAEMSLFFDSMSRQALAYDNSALSCVAYLKFHGDNQHVVTGINLYDGKRYKVQGHQSICCLAASDITWKQNIEPLSSSLEKVMLLQGVSYDWKVDEYPEKGFTKNRQIGFIAQDVEKVFPELVRTDTNGYKGVYYGQMVPVLLEAMKEQQKEISELKKQQAMIAELTEKIAQLQKALEEKGSKLSASVK